MRAALSYNPEHEEVPVGSTEVLESNVVAIREELKEFKADFREHKHEVREAINGLRDELKDHKQEVNEAIDGLRDELRDHKKEFTAAIARLDLDIKSVASELRAEIRAMAAKAESDLKQFAARVDEQLREMRAEQVALRDKIDKNFGTLNNKIDVTNANVVQLGKEVHTTSTKLTLLLWLVGSLVAAVLAAVPVIIAVGTARGWFK